MTLDVYLDKQTPEVQLELISAALSYTFPGQSVDSSQTSKCNLSDIPQ
jgi:hypothetical protein